MNNSLMVVLFIAFSLGLALCCAIPVGLRAAYLERKRKRLLQQYEIELSNNPDVALLLEQYLHVERQLETLRRKLAEVERMINSFYYDLRYAVPSDTKFLKHKIAIFCYRRNHLLRRKQQCLATRLDLVSQLSTLFPQWEHYLTIRR